MYKCFEPIPLEVRQAAYDIIAADRRKWNEDAEKFAQENPGKFSRGRLSLWISLGEGKERDSYCPLGVVNHALGIHEGRRTHAPSNGAIERDILAQVGIDINPRSAQRFIEAVDGYRLSTPAKLARAMGVEPRDW